MLTSIVSINHFLLNVYRCKSMWCFQIRREFNLGNFDLEIHAMIICETGFMIKWRVSESKL